MDHIVYTASQEFWTVEYWDDSACEGGPVEFGCYKYKATAEAFLFSLAQLKNRRPI